MTRSFNRIAAAALIALATGPFMAAQAATSNDADLASAVQSSLCLLYTSPSPRD